MAVISNDSVPNHQFCSRKATTKTTTTTSNDVTTPWRKRWLSSSCCGHCCYFCSCCCDNNHSTTKTIGSRSSSNNTKNQKRQQKSRKTFLSMILLFILFLFVLLIIIRDPSSSSFAYRSYYLDPNLMTTKTNATTTTKITTNMKEIQDSKHPTNTISSLHRHSSLKSGATDENFDNDNSDNGIIPKNGISKKLPRWMRDYMGWHRQRLLELHEQEKQYLSFMSPNNNNNTTSSMSNSPWLDQPMLIVRCLEHDRCGGTSDRLKSIPVFILLAAKTNRLLFIRWTRPFRLEEFLLPGPALNWTVPNGLQHILNGSNSSSSSTAGAGADIMKNVPYFQGKDVQKMIAAASVPPPPPSTIINDNDNNNEYDSSTNNNNNYHWLIEGNIQFSGGKLYSNLVQSHQRSKGLPIDDWDYTTYYHDLFPSIFIPSPGIQRLWKMLQEQWNLVPNQFMVAHYRAKYPKEPYLESSRNVTILKETIVNAIHCAAAAAAATTTATADVSTAGMTTQGVDNNILSTSIDSNVVVVYVASDTILALEKAQEYFASKEYGDNANGTTTTTTIPTIRVVSHLNLLQQGLYDNNGNADDTNNNNNKTIDDLVPEDPPHLNFAKKASPGAFFSIFLDLWVMSQSRCVSFGAGGFGRFGSLVSHNMSCRVAHSIKGQLQQCS